jgi:hypothetical protein
MVVESGAARLARLVRRTLLKQHKLLQKRESLFHRGVLARIAHRKIPRVETLTTLLQVLYETSFDTEERKELRCHVVYLDPWDVSHEERRRMGKILCHLGTQPMPRWQATELDHWVNGSWRPIEFSRENLRKVCLASDPRASWIAVFPAMKWRFPGLDEDVPEEKAPLVIWALVDQMLHYHTFIRGESKMPAALPGMFWCAIEGSARLSVHRSYASIAGLSGGRILRSSHPVFASGLFRNALDSYSKRIVRASIANVRPKSAFLETALTAEWCNIVRRVVLSARSCGHGGSYLVVPRGFEAEGTVSVKYKLSYDRLTTAFLKYCRGAAWFQMEAAKAARLERGDIQYWETTRAMEPWDRVRQEIEACIHFIASLSRVDGAVVWNSDGTILGFGTEITLAEEIPELWGAEDPDGKRFRRIDPKVYGMRHRSVMRFCWKHAGSLGLVISEDGPIRAMMRLGKRLLFWENVDAYFPPMPKKWRSVG